MRAVDDVKEIFFQKIAGWKAKVLSHTGRTMLIKYVASAIPSYLMSFYSMPLQWCKDIDKALKNFWWGFKGGSNRHLTLKAWNSICVPKSDGGLGIRLTSEVNEALISKLAWKMLTDRQSLWVRDLHGKYVKGREFWQVGVGRKASWVWKSIVNSLHALSEGMC